MVQPYNKLGFDEAERLVYLIEELSETNERLAQAQQAISKAIQSASKVLRHGKVVEGTNEDDEVVTYDNIYNLSQEAGNVLFALDMLIHNNDIMVDVVHRSREHKCKTAAKYFHHQ